MPILGDRSRRYGPRHLILCGEIVLGRAARFRSLTVACPAWAKGHGFFSANASLAIRLLARENSVAKQDPALLRQVSLPSRSGKVDRNSSLAYGAGSGTR
jgi:hypothetical protein